MYHPTTEIVMRKVDIKINTTPITRTVMRKVGIHSYSTPSQRPSWNNEAAAVIARNQIWKRNRSEKEGTWPTEPPVEEPCLSPHCERTCQSWTELTNRRRAHSWSDRLHCSQRCKRWMANIVPLHEKTGHFLLLLLLKRKLSHLQ